jgi:hypothetical protein
VVARVEVRVVDLDRARGAGEPILLGRRDLHGAHLVLLGLDQLRAANAEHAGVGAGYPLDPQVHAPQHLVPLLDERANALVRHERPNGPDPDQALAHVDLAVLHALEAPRERGLLRPAQYALPLGAGDGIDRARRVLRHAGGSARERGAERERDHTPCQSSDLHGANCGSPRRRSVRSSSEP